MVPDQATRIGQLSRSSVLRAWLASRAVVLLAVLVAHVLAGVFAGVVFGGLLSWDAGWYRDIALHGYAGARDGAVRFFPLWPLLGRLGADLSGLSAGVALVVLANAAALAYLMLGRRLALVVGMSAEDAERVPVVVALAPAGAVLVMGYTEALFGVALCVVLLGARTGRWWWCAAAGLVAGAMRPTGVVVALPAAIEACRGWRTASARQLAERLAAVAAPFVGLAAYLGWSWHAYGDPLTPFRAQTAPELRGGTFVSPLHTLATIPHLRDGTEILDLAINLTVTVVAVALLVVCARRLPPSFTAYAVVTILLSITARALSSSERYLCGAVPLLLAAALVLGEHPRLRRVAVVLAPVLLLGQATLVFTGYYLP